MMAGAVARPSATSSGTWSIVHRAAFRGAVRTTLVTPLMVALTLEVLDNAAMASFAGLGSFVLFRGTARAFPTRPIGSSAQHRARAYLVE